MAPIIETLKAALGPHWARIALMSAGGSYAIVAFVISAINGFSESHQFDFLFPNIPKVTYTLVVLVLLLALCFGRYAHKLRLAAVPALKIEEVIYEPFHPDHGITNVKISLKVKNTGETALTNCLVKLVDLSGDESRYGEL